MFFTTIAVGGAQGGAGGGPGAGGGGGGGGSTWPPPLIDVVDRVDLTPQHTQHPKDHDDLQIAVNETITILGTAPEGTFTDLTGRLAALDTEVVTVESEVTTLQTDVATVQGDITTLQTDVTTAQGDITTVEGEITTIQTNVTTLQTDVTTAEGDITTLQTDVTTAQGDITTLQTDMTTAQADITTAEGDITTIQANVTTLQTDMTTAQADITTADSNITTLQTDVTTAQSDITTLQTDVATADSNITTLQTDMTTAQADIIALQGDVGEVEKFSTDPVLTSADAGRFWFNTTDDVYRFWDGAQVISLAPVPDALTAGAGISIVSDVIAVTGVTSDMITDGTIVDADISAGAAIAVAKINGALGLNSLVLGAPASNPPYYIVPHGLSRLPSFLELWTTGTPQQRVYASMSADTTNIYVNFTTAPSNGAYQLTWS